MLIRCCPLLLSNTAACAAAPGVKGIAAGGNDDLIPGWFVAYDPAQASIIVAHQGTNPTSLCVIVCLRASLLD
jgi:hypothetical protein